jgi:hypothetical protein
MLYQSAAQSPHTIDIEMIRYGQHQQSANLRATLQRSIDASAGQGYQAVVLAYGLCGKSTDGLTARDIPLVIPRAHDCITLFLGSRARYNQEFAQTPGTYWYVQDYLERDDGSGTSLAIGANTSTDAEALRASYVEKYGEDNADYLMEVMGAWQAHYQRAGFIDLGLADSSKIESQAKDDAAKRGWTFERLPGNLDLIRRLLNGDWDQDYLVLQPGQSIAMSFDDSILTCLPLKK